MLWESNLEKYLGQSQKNIFGQIARMTWAHRCLHLPNGWGHHGSGSLRHNLWEYLYIVASKHSYVNTPDTVLHHKSSLEQLESCSMLAAEVRRSSKTFLISSEHKEYSNVLMRWPINNEEAHKLKWWSCKIYSLLILGIIHTTQEISTLTTSYRNLS